MKHNPFKIVSDFEETVADYTGSPYAVAVDSCTNALFLCLKYYDIFVLKKKDKREINIPSKTYISPAMSILHAGYDLILDPQMNNWTGIYQLRYLAIYDAAKRFTSKMYIPDSFMCLSFHIKKHLKLGKGGMILTDNLEARDWFRKACYEGRSREVGIHEDNIAFAGWNMYMEPQRAAIGLALMQNYPEHVPDLPNNYRDLRTFELFKHCKILNQ